MNKQEKQDAIEKKFKSIMEILGLDLDDDSLQDTPRRVAKMYVHELFSGLDTNNYPKITTQLNKFGYDEMLIETGIEINSVCEHHFVPIIGKCHIAYIPGKKVIGLSKLNRIAHYYAARPQVQEKLTQQIKDDLVEALGVENVAVVIDAAHMCVKMRGIKDSDCITRTSALGGFFRSDISCRTEFFNSLPRL